MCLCVTCSMVGGWGQESVRARCCGTKLWGHCPLRNTKAENVTTQVTPSRLPSLSPPPSCICEGKSDRNPSLRFLYLPISHTRQVPDLFFFSYSSCFLIGTSTQLRLKQIPLQSCHTKTNPGGHSCTSGDVCTVSRVNSGPSILSDVG